MSNYRNFNISSLIDNELSTITLPENSTTDPINQLTDGHLTAVNKSTANFSIDHFLQAPVNVGIPSVQEEKHPHKCGACISQFTSMMHLNNHFKSSHFDDLRLAKDYHKLFAKDMVKAEIMRICGLPINGCSTADMSKQIRDHMKGWRQRDSQNVMRLQCTNCVFKAKWPAQMEKHLLVHSS